jgi:hypothetical protein
MPRGRCSLFAGRARQIGCPCSRLDIRRGFDVKRCRNRKALSSVYDRCWCEGSTTVLLDGFCARRNVADWSKLPKCALRLEPYLRAHTAACVRFLACIFRKIAFTCTFTVDSVIPQSRAMTLLGCPAVSFCNTWTSRNDSVSSRVFASMSMAPISVLRLQTLSRLFAGNTFSPRTTSSSDLTKTSRPILSSKIPSTLHSIACIMTVSSDACASSTTRASGCSARNFSTMAGRSLSFCRRSTRNTRRLFAGKRDSDSSTTEL